MGMGRPMTDESDADRDPDREDEAGVPDTDPRHIDPAGDLAAAFENGDLSAELVDTDDAGELREFVERAEAGEFDLRADPGLEATVRIVRALLANSDTDEDGEV